MSLVDVKTQAVTGGSIAIIFVGASSAPSRDIYNEIDAALQRAGDDAAVRAIVLTGIATKNMKDDAFPALKDLILRLDAMKKPTIAAMGAPAAGPGLPVYLACRYRLANKSARISFPDIDMGRVPAFATQLLPRVVGANYAIELLVGGKAISPDRAVKMGLLDEVADGDVTAAAIKYAENLIVSEQRKRHATAQDGGGTEMDRKFPRGMALPALIIDCIEAAGRMPLNEGITYAQDVAQAFSKATEHDALAYAAVAEHIAIIIPDVPADTPKREIKTAAVMGAGTMGGGITMCFANAGIPVTLVEVKQEALDKGLAVIKRNYQATASKGRLTQADVDKRMGLITGSLDRSSMATADIIVEAVDEDLCREALRGRPC